MWNLTEYAKVFVFDADTLAMRNVSKELLLAHPAFSASAHVRGRYVNRYRFSVTACHPPLTSHFVSSSHLALITA